MTGLIDDLPWRSLSPQALEELTYAILEEMGATRVTWRSSEESINAPDGGRDIEAVFVRPTPDDDVDRQVWWLECKRRAGSVSPTDVKEAVLNATAHTDIAAFIVVTNMHFSNPTRDWVDKHNEARRGPVVKLWDRRRLQSLLEKHPSAAARSLHTLLNFEQRIKFLSDYFFERTRNVTELELRDAWDRRSEIDNVPFLVAASYADICSGSIHERPWMSLLAGDDELLRALLICLDSLIGKMVASHPLVNDSLMDTISYVLAAAATSLPTPAVAATIGDPWKFRDSPDSTPEAVLKHVLRPVKVNTANKLQEQCANDCARFNMDREIPSSIASFWEKYVRVPTRDEEKWQLCLVDLKVPCAVGLEVNSEIECPLTAVEYLDDNEKYVDMLRRVILFRSENPSGQFLKYSSINHDRAIDGIVSGLVGDDTRQHSDD